MVLVESNADVLMGSWDHESGCGLVRVVWRPHGSST